MITIDFSVYNRNDERIGRISEKVDHAYCYRCGDCLVCSHDAECWNGGRGFAVVYAETLEEAREELRQKAMEDPQR